MINLYDVLEAADGQLFGEPGAQIFTDFCYDSRRVQPGEVFVALKTGGGDGHQYIGDAIAGGATGVMCTNPPSIDTQGVTIIVMRSVEDALMRWAQLALRKYGTTVIAVTGSAGKSTTKEAIAQVLGTRYRVYKSDSSVSGRLSLPLALGRLTQDYPLAVLEFGIDQPGEMAALIEGAQPAAGVVTSIGHAHTDQLFSPEIIAREKGELIRALPSDGLAVLNFDDPLVRAMAAETRARVTTMGLDTSGRAFGADLLAYNILVDRYKTGFDLRYGHERIAGRWFPLLGAHHLYSALAALAVGLHYEIGLDDALQALTELEPLPGRMRPLPGVNGSLLIDDSFSASPEGMRAALDWMQAVRDERGKLVLVMGDLDDLGSYVQLAEVELGQHAAEIVDRLVAKGDLAAEVARIAIEHGLARDRVQITYSAEDAAHAAASVLEARDIVLVKGSPGARMEQVARALLADERDAVRLARQAAVYEPVWTDRSSRPTWVQVDMEAVAYNTRRLKEIVGPDVTLMAVVKADAYGHGAVPVSITALNNGADALGVASISEAIALREAGITAPVLILGYTPSWAARHVLHHDLLVTLYDLEMARAFDRAAREMDATLRAHVRVDTGAGGVGLLPGEVTGFFRGLRNMQHTHIAGIYTHLAAMDEDRNGTQEQIALFNQVIEPLAATGFTFEAVHAASSAAAIHLPEARYNLVRAGIALYGLDPGPAAPLPADFRPALEWKTTIAQVKRLPPGGPGARGGAYRTREAERIAIIPVGYADGFRCAPRCWQHVLVRGEFAPLVGQVSMEHATIDVSQIEDVRPGDEVVLIGQQGERRITVDDAAAFLETTHYEVVSTILARVPRVK
ncbi:MAG: alanine racemase [Chloroflexi bacterium]|nr:alanine racemase [Chloroflexota bacterium]